MKNSLLILLALLGLTTCQPQLNLPIDSVNNKSLNSLLTLKIGSNTVYLQDFITNPNQVDSITSSSTKIDCKLSADKKTASIQLLKNTETFVNLKVWIKGSPYSIPCRKYDTKDNSFFQDSKNADKLPKLSTHQFGLSSISLSATNEIKKIFVYWQNFLLPDELVLYLNGKIQISIPAEAQKIDRSFIRVWASNDFGVSNDILIPLDKGGVLTDTKQITNEDKQAEITYFVLAENIKKISKINNQFSNDQPVGQRDNYLKVNFSEIKQRANKGYFKDLGVSSLIISSNNPTSDSKFGLNNKKNSKLFDQLNFKVYEAAQATFIRAGNNDLKQVENILESSLYSYGNHNLLGNISGAHEKQSFVSNASNKITLGEKIIVNQKLHTIEVANSIDYKKLFLLHTFNMTIPGIPVIIYGDEIGLTGLNNQNFRSKMKFDGLTKQEEALLKQVKTLTHLRSENSQFIYGDFINIQASNDSWVYARKYFDKQAIVFINNSSKPKSIEVEIPKNLKIEELKSSFNHTFVISNSYNKNKIKIELPAYSADILL